MNIRLFKPSLGEEELQAIREAFERSWIGLGPKVNEFEKKWAEFTGAKIAIGLNSATAAYILRLQFLNFLKEKSACSITYFFIDCICSTLQPISTRFVDSDPITLGISLKDLNKSMIRLCCYNPCALRRSSCSNGYS